MNILFKAIAVAAASFTAGSASAAILNVTVDPTKSVQESDVYIDNDVDDGFGFSLLGNGGATASGFAGEASDLFITMTGFFDAFVPATAAFSVDGFNAVLGSDTLLDYGVQSTGADDGTDVIEFLFGGLTGEHASEFGSLALVTLIGEFGAAPLEQGFSTLGNVTINAATPVPLPASLPLLIAGIGLIGIAKRRNG